MPISRRDFLARGAAATAAVATPLTSVFSTGVAEAQDSPFGPLLEDPAGILNLPAGFSYVVVQRRGDIMSDGVAVPGRPDGMAAFESGPSDPPGSIILMRNHEVRPGDDDGESFFSGRPTPEQLSMMPDPGGRGGVSRVLLDGTTLRPLASNAVLAGTHTNCAGGPSPWGWISCEENTDALSNLGAPPRASTDWHGYAYVTRTEATGLAMPERIDAYGRFNHEAVAIDTVSHTAYLTEDRSDGYFYRFVPDERSAPFGAGRFQVLARMDEDGFDTATMATGESFRVAWRDIENPVPNVDDDEGTGADRSVRQQASDALAARIVRGEGCWIDEVSGAVYFAATSGGEDRLGQIFRYIPDRPSDPDAGGRLECIANPEDEEVMVKPDNLAVAPWGDVFIVEDASSQCRLLVLNPATGAILPIAQNPNASAELCGVCFAPGRRDVVFVNLQREGVTLAITGPFEGDPTDPDPEDGGVDSGLDAASPDGGPFDGGSVGDAPAETGGCRAGSAAPVAESAGLVAATALLMARSSRGQREDAEES